MFWSKIRIKWSMFRNKIWIKKMFWDKIWINKMFQNKIQIKKMFWIKKTFRQPNMNVPFAWPTKPIMSLFLVVTCFVVDVSIKWDKSRNFVQNAEDLLQVLSKCTFDFIGKNVVLINLLSFFKINIIYSILVLIFGFFAWDFEIICRV